MRQGVFGVLVGGVILSLILLAPALFGHSYGGYSSFFPESERDNSMTVYHIGESKRRAGVAAAGVRRAVYSVRRAVCSARRMNAQEAAGRPSCLPARRLLAAEAPRRSCAACPQPAGPEAPGRCQAARCACPL